MKPSILTLREVSFLRVLIDKTPDFKGKASDFDFEGANLGWSIKHGRHSDGEEVWWVGVTFAMKSEPDKICPYQIDMKAAGMFDIADSVPAERREEIVFENGAALIFGAIREMVSTITARSYHGMLILPTASFIGSFAGQREEQPQGTDTQISST